MFVVIIIIIIVITTSSAAKFKQLLARIRKMHAEQRTRNMEKRRGVVVLVSRLELNVWNIFGKNTRV